MHRHLSLTLASSMIKREDQRSAILYNLHQIANVTPFQPAIVSNILLRPLKTNHNLQRLVAAAN
jgi:hypothetical protein